MKRTLPCLLLLVTSAVRPEVIDVSEATNLTLAVHPASEFIAIDLLGGLWRLPLTGGGAIALIPAGSGVAQPRFDAGGEEIVFQRWQNGQWDIWRLNLATGDYEALTETPYNEREPEYSPDGREVVFAGDRAGSYSLWSLDLETGALRQLTEEPGSARFPTYDSTGTLAYINTDGDRSEIRTYAGGPRGQPLIESRRLIDAPSWRPGGGVLIVNERSADQETDLWLHIDADEPVSRRLTANEDIFIGRVAWISPEEYIYAADGALWRRGIASVTRTRILLFAGVNVEEAEPTLVNQRLDAAGPHPVAGINGLDRHDPSGRFAFSALSDLWLVDDGELLRLTDDRATDADPAFTPDGEWLVFVSDRGGTMDLWRYRIESGLMLQVSGGPGRAFAPSVSADGRYVAYLEAAGLSPWDAAAVKLIDFDHPFQPETLDGSLYEAGDLSWQGRYLRLPARDTVDGEPYAHVFETDATDERLPAADDPVTLPPDLGTAALSWQPATAEAPYVIQAGRLFDGTGTDYRYHVDIHIEGQRIAAIVARDRLPLPDRVIDATESTVVPGLIDVHTHLTSLGGAETGRLWLASGVTTVRDVTSDWRRALERAETWASGQQPGPRVIVAPLTADAEASLLANSPIVVGTGNQILGGGTHAFADQLARDGQILSVLPPLFRASDTGNGPRLALSASGRSYGDVFGQIRASRMYLATGLGALELMGSVVGSNRLADAFERTLRDSGRIAIGSDAPAVPYGAGFHRELALLSRRGVPTDQILRYATASGGIALGLSLQIGTLEPGRLADLVVVDGDPLNQLRDLERIEAVVLGGVLHDRDALDGAR